MSTKESPLYSLFGSKTRVNLIILLVMHPGEAYYIRQLASLLKQSVTPVVRELAKLEQLGLVTSETKANAKYFIVNQQSPFFPELQSLVLKTAGVGDLLRDQFKTLASLAFAFIYGSFAKGEATPKSDIDLFFIGEIPVNQLTKAVKSAEMRIGREIQYSFFDPKEFLKKLQEGNAFIKQVAKAKKIMLIGEIRDFRRYLNLRFALSKK